MHVNHDSEVVIFDDRDRLLLAQLPPETPIREAMGAFTLAYQAKEQAEIDLAVTLFDTSVEDAYLLGFSQVGAHRLRVSILNQLVEGLGEVVAPLMLEELQASLSAE